MEATEKRTRRSAILLPLSGHWQHVSLQTSQHRSSLSPKWSPELFKNASCPTNSSQAHVAKGKREEEEQDEDDLPGPQEDEESPESCNAGRNDLSLS